MAALKKRKVGVIKPEPLVCIPSKQRNVDRWACLARMRILNPIPPSPLPHSPCRGYPLEGGGNVPMWHPLLFVYYERN